MHRTRTWHSAWSCRALTLDPALVDADQEPRLDDSTDSNGNMKTSYHTFTHLMALYDNVLSEKKLCFFTSFFPVSLLDVWTLEPGMSESFFLPCFFPFYKMSCIAFACVDRFSSHAFVRYPLYFPWSEYKNRYHFSNPMHLIRHESITLHLLPPVMMMLSTTDKSRGSGRRNVWS